PNCGMHAAISGPLEGIIPEPFRIIWGTGACCREGWLSRTAPPPEKHTPVQVENTTPTRAALTMVWEPCFGCTRTILGWLASGVAVISALAESAGWCQWSPVRLLCPCFFPC